MPRKPYGNPVFAQNGTPEPIMKGDEQIGTRWRDERGNVIYAEIRASESPMRLSPETQRALKEIDDYARQGTHLLRRTVLD